MRRMVNTTIFYHLTIWPLGAPLNQKLIILAKKQKRNALYGQSALEENN